MKKLIVLLIIIIVNLAVTTYVKGIEEDVTKVRIVHDVEFRKPTPWVDLKGIGNITLVVYKKFGVINGYIVFTDKKGVMCSVTTSTWHGKITVEQYEREEQLSPEKFQWIETKGRDELWVYLLEPIPIDKEKIRKEDPIVNFEIPVKSLRASAIAH